MRNHILTAVFLATASILAGAGYDAPERSPETIYENSEGQQVRGNWSSGDNIIEIKTVEEYYWHRDNFDPSVHYEVAPWLYDPFNLSMESGGDSEKN